MEHKTPEWLTPQFLEKCFERTEEFKGMKIFKMSSAPAVTVGNNFGSTVLRVSVDYKMKEEDEACKLSLVLKAPLTEGVLKNLQGTTDCEPVFYYSFLPEAYKICKHRFAPESFPSESSTVVILEDLNNKGFIMADRTKQLDFEHCKLYMKAAATFHGVSFVLCDGNPDLIKSFKGKNIFTNESQFGPVFRNVIKYGLKCAATHVTNERHLKILLRCIDIAWDMLVDVQIPSDNFNCLRQGDPWTTNMMFKYDNGEVKDIKLIDFQNLTYGTPVLDLVFFIWTSANADVRKSRLKDLYQFYFKCLTENLKDMGVSKDLNYEEFTQEIQKYNPLAMWIFAVIPCSINPIAADYNSLFSKLHPSNGELENNPFDEHYTDSYCQYVLPQYLEHFELEGVLDYFENK